jgi:hypothetical protein
VLVAAAAAETPTLPTIANVAARTNRRIDVIGLVPPVID